MVSISRDTNRRATIKIKLVARPIATHATMMSGPSTVGVGISSIMCATASPKSQAKPSGHPVLLMKLVNTKLRSYQIDPQHGNKRTK